MLSMRQGSANATPRNAATHFQQHGDDVCTLRRGAAFSDGQRGSFLPASRRIGAAYQSSQRSPLGTLLNSPLRRLPTSPAETGPEVTHSSFQRGVPYRADIFATAANSSSDGEHVATSTDQVEAAFDIDATDLPKGYFLTFFSLGTLLASNPLSPLDANMVSI
jgi:hypothetical protein